MIKYFHMWLCYLLLTLLPSINLYAQLSGDPDSSSNIERSYIQWIEEFPSGHDQKEKKGIFNRIGRFVFGKRPVTLTYPMAICAENPKNYYAIDQKVNSLILVEEKKAKLANTKQKEEFEFHSLVDLCEIPQKKILITDSRLNKVFEYDNKKKRIIELNESLVLQQPTGIAYSKQNDQIWVIETKAHRIAILNSDGELIKQIGIRGNAPGEFNFPTHIWIDKNGLVYIVDSMNFRVQIYDNEGNWLSMFGQAGDASGFFARPKGIATDSHGNIYIADALFHTVQIFNREGQFLYNFGAQGHNKGDFWMPNGIYIDSENFIYVADSYNSRVQIFQLVNHERIEY